MKNIITGLLGVLFVAAITGCATNHPVKSDNSAVAVKQQPYVCIKTTKPMKIDGKLNEPI